MSALRETLRSLAEVLDGQEIKWYIFGAQAVSIRGAPRATQDIDVTIAIDVQKIDALLAGLEAEGLRHRYPLQRDELLARAAVLPLIHTSGMEVDLVLAGSGLEQLAMSRREHLDVEGLKVPVAQTTDLVVMKVLAGRGKDLDDVRSLLASDDADVDEARDLLSQMEEALERSDLVRVLEDALADVGRL